MRHLRSLLPLFLLAGCATTGTTSTLATAPAADAAAGADAADSATAAAKTEASADARQHLERGDEALRSNNFEEAMRSFEHVRTHYPFESAAITAELRLADVDFQRDAFLEARDRYLNFVKLHPTSDRVDYAAFRAALTHQKEIPGDFFLVPSSREKDQAEALNALREMREFVRTYPESKYAEEARQIITDTTRRLAEHELYVADFYAKRKRWPGVVLRLNTLLSKYPDSGYQERALFGLHDAYVKLGESEKAQETLRRIVDTLPGTPAAERARGMLGG